MTNIAAFKKDPAHVLWETLEDLHAGMFGIQGAKDHMQPMSHFCDRAKGKLYFITSSDTDIVSHIGDGAIAHFCIVSKGQDLHGCLSGAVSLSQDDAKIDELWSTVADAWFEGGRSDPKVRLIEMSLDEASLWASTGNPFKFGFEIARAKMSDELPDVGAHVTVSFPKTA
nr:pyridoxamine 5'-phosphate oxidase family protein [uncultured Celeribacter sp.]